jgi:hypothetical protein
MSDTTTSDVPMHYSPHTTFFVMEYKKKIMSIPLENLNSLQYVTVYVESPNIAVPKGK